MSMQEQQQMGTQHSFKAIDQLRYDAGSISLNLQATVGRRLSNPVERLSTTARLNEWLLKENLIDQVLPLDEADLSKARLFREVVYRITKAVLEGLHPLPADIEALNLVARGTMPSPQLHISTQEQISCTCTHLFLPNLDSALTAIACDTIALLTGEHVKALHMCEADDCSMIFIDTSRGHRRHWCSNDRCGNKVRVAAHRARQHGR